MTKRIALIKGGKVHDVIIAGDGFKPPKGSICIESENANIGDAHDGVSFLQPDPPTKERLIQHAVMFRNTFMKRFALDFGDEQIWIHDEIRRDIGDLETLGIDATFAFGDRVVKLTAVQIEEIHTLISSQMAHSYDVLGKVVTAIESGKITDFDEVNAPETIELDPWRRLS